VVLSDYLVVVRGGGGLGSAVAHRLARSGFTVLVTELAQPLALRRGADFAEAVYRGQAQVEGITARLANDAMLGMAFTVVGELPVVVDMADDVVARMRPALVVDARQAGARLGTRREDANLVIGLGPGFVAGRDCHVVVATRPGPDLGQVFWEAEPLAEADAPEMKAAGLMLLRAPAEGTFAPLAAIGDQVQAGTRLGTLDGRPLAAPMGGVLRGLLHDGVPAAAGQPVAEIDPTIRPEDCFLISPAARAVAGGVLEAALAGLDLWQREDDGRLLEVEEPLPVIQAESPVHAKGDRDDE